MGGLFFSGPKTIIFWVVFVATQEMRYTVRI